MMKEIGSEFWNCEPQNKQYAFVLSGRTALEFIIRDIKKLHHVKSVLLPSYCCHTMIEPFVRHHIPIRFYDVYFDKKIGLTVDIPDIHSDEIFYSIQYFGFIGLNGVDLISVREKSMVMIEDCTHSWLTNVIFDKADYRYTSYRKWTGFDGIASAFKLCSDFKCAFPTKHHDAYCALRNEAFRKKKAFVEHGFGEKQEFLSLFNEAEKLLEKDYCDYLPTDEMVSALVRIDKQTVIQSRRRNAEALLNGLKDVDEINLYYDRLDEHDVPLFVPIQVPERRDELRKWLIKHDIYCPVHWPLSEFHQGISERAKEIYRQELSLLCDQRYDVNDMQRIVNTIKNYDWRMV